MTELVGAGVAKTSLGRAVLPDELPDVTGPIGLLGSTASDAMMKNADTLLFVGNQLPVRRMAARSGSVQGRGGGAS